MGIAVPFVVQAIRIELLPKLSAKGSFLLSLAMAALVTGIAYSMVDPTPTWGEGLGNLGVAFTLSQTTYRMLEEKLKGPDKDKPEDEE